jgi:hypothetical protein
MQESFSFSARKKVTLSRGGQDAKSIEGAQEPAPKVFGGDFSFLLCLHQTGRNDLIIPLRLCA